MLQDDRASRRLEVDEHGLPCHASTDIWSATTSRAPSRPASATTSQAPSRCASSPCLPYTSPCCASLLSITMCYAILHCSKPTAVSLLQSTTLQHSRLPDIILCYAVLLSVIRCYAILDSNSLITLHYTRTQKQHHTTSRRITSHHTTPHLTSPHTPRHTTNLSVQNVRRLTILHCS